MCQTNTFSHSLRTITKVSVGKVEIVVREEKRFLLLDM